VSLINSYNRRMGFPARRQRFEARSDRNVQPTNQVRAATSPHMEKYVASMSTIPRVRLEPAIQAMVRTSAVGSPASMRMRLGLPDTRRAGITVTELLVSLAIVTLLLAVVIPAVQAARESSRKITCRSNLRQFGIALSHYVATFGQYPRARSRGPSHVQLLPFLEQGNTYDAYFSSASIWKSGDLARLPRIATFQCASDLNYARVHGVSYGQNVGHCETPPGRTPLNPWPCYNGVFDDKRSSMVVRPQSIREGLTQTCAFAEIKSMPRPDGHVFLDTPHDFLRCGAGVSLANHCRLNTSAQQDSVIQCGSSWFDSRIQVTG